MSQICFRFQEFFVKLQLVHFLSGNTFVQFSTSERVDLGALWIDPHGHEVFATIGKVCYHQ